MRVELLFSSHYRKQKGSFLLTAVALLIVLALLGTGVLTLWLSQNATINQQILSSRVRLAAQSGEQWMINALFSTQKQEAEQADVSGESERCSSMSQQIEFEGQGLAGCAVRLGCGFVDDGLVGLYHLTTQAECGRGQNTVRHTQAAWIKQSEANLMPNKGQN
ncbi:MAG: hypothetical protein ACRC9T_05640 [Vibrionaceae bacterium]